MATTPGNSINATATGVQYFGGTSFTNASIKQTTYTGSNTWTPDTRMKYAKIYIWNGGSGGGSGRCGANGAAAGGGGGAGGFFTCLDILSSNLQSPSYFVTIGAGVC